MFPVRTTIFPVIEVVMAVEALNQAVEAGELRRAASILEKAETSWVSSEPWPYHVHQMMLHFATVTNYSPG